MDKDEELLSSPTVTIVEEGESYINDDEGVPTTTSIAQQECEESCLAYLYEDTQEKDAEENGNSSSDATTSNPLLLRDSHVKYCKRGLEKLGRGFTALDASKPWLMYWMIHSISLLNGEITEKMKDRVVDTLEKYQNNDTGGFGGGFFQLSHCAPTYSGILTLMSIGTKKAYDVINRKKMYQFFLARKASSGGFSMHDDGENDVRATYTVLAVASILNILTPELVKGTAEWVAQCQTYEGGFGGEPFNEAHGGYTFCGLASLCILKQTNLINMKRLLRWITRRQMLKEGGYQGRTHKLVDACYSFWQGSTPAMLYLATNGKYSTPTVDNNNNNNNDVINNIWNQGDLICDQLALQKYILLCCQQHDGGLRDKPSKFRDFYHTCYALSGLSIAQNGVGNVSNTSPIVYKNKLDHVDQIQPTHPIYNVRQDKLLKAMEYFLEISGGTTPSHDVLVNDELE